uniref:RING-type E3 ubiquitin transferase n=1 Tax=Strigops habroptila TaxID=2489341 RepID=A0A672V4T7_STRHB
MDSQPQPVESVAMELEDRCPICLGSWEEASYVTPCLHQFCYECILRWAETKPECPLSGMMLACRRLKPTEDPGSVASPAFGSSEHFCL